MAGEATTVSVMRSACGAAVVVAVEAHVGSLADQELHPLVGLVRRHVAVIAAAAVSRGAPHQASV